MVANQPGKRIKELRIEKNLLQEKLAGYLNVSQQTVSKIETGTSDIPYDLLIKLADFFKVSIDYIYGRTEIRDMLTEEKIMNEYNEIISSYTHLNKIDQKTIRTIIKRLEEAEKEKGDGESELPFAMMIKYLQEN
ncbi:helix-turn-helix domain-containing protein [Ignavigranum ruoffiae]|uniref:helix-turn-helix domain-containing protein n=1 Tax=Ignavigranum ruoffiae TaxID=89093 RepID=UPI0020590DF7|nr:helix-turn-helix transcriptional regulator [Ignavigranum ruoffiae]UPQ86127.1 helix-turn-helix domain-containing protein [Ignavigranum ruoffiae]